MVMIMGIIGTAGEGINILKNTFYFCRFFLSGLLLKVYAVLCPLNSLWLAPKSNMFIAIIAVEEMPNLWRYVHSFFTHASSKNHNVQFH